MEIVKYTNCVPICKKIWNKIINKIKIYKYKYRYKYSKEYDFNNDLKWCHDLKFYYSHNNKWRLIELYKTLFPQDVDMDKQAVKRVIGNDISFLGRDYYFQNDSVDWHLDPVSGSNWEKIFFADIAFKGADRLGDVKYPWELSKHQFFIILGKIYWLTGDEKYANKFKEHVISWIQENPRYEGINWISGLEIGMRLISWIMAFYFFKKSSCLDEEFKKLFFCSIYMQANYIYENLSTYGTPNNHLIGEASALIITSLFIKSNKSEKYLAESIQVLEKEIKRQFFADGVNKEQSPNYHRLSLEFYYIVQILLKKNNRTFSSDTLKRMEIATEALMLILTPDRGAPLFGDADNARGIYITDNCKDDYKGLIALGAVLFNRGDFKFISHNISEEVLWLLGEDGVEKYNKIDPFPPVAESCLFKQGGYYVMKNDWDASANYLIFDCGPLGYGSAGHGHADALSFQLYWEGNNVFVDPGTYSYNLDYSWRDYFRSTPAHNTITVDGYNQSEINDRMSWKTFAHSTCNLWMSTEWFDIVDGEHDGYMRLDDPVMHRRIVFFNKSDYCLIVDILSCKGPHVFDYYLHIHPGCSSVIDFPNKRVEIHLPNREDISVGFLNESKRDLNLSFFQGDEETKLGWFSDGYGTKMPCNTLRARKWASGNTGFMTMISNNNIEADIRINEDNVLILSMHNQKSATEDMVYYSLSSTVKIEGHNILFYGKFIYLRKVNGKFDTIYSTDFSELAIESKLKICAEGIIKSFKYSKGEYEIVTADDEVDGLSVFGSDINKVFINNREYMIRNGSPIPLK